MTKIVHALLACSCLVGSAVLGQGNWLPRSWFGQRPTQDQGQLRSDLEQLQSEQEYGAREFKKGFSAAESSKFPLSAPAALWACKGKNECDECGPDNKGHCVGKGLAGSLKFLRCHRNDCATLTAGQACGEAGKNTTCQQSQTGSCLLCNPTPSTAAATTATTPTAASTAGTPAPAPSAPVAASGPVTPSVVAPSAPVVIPAAPLAPPSAPTISGAAY